MAAGWCARAIRAAVFAAVCVLLAALGHVLMSGTTVPWWAPAAGLAVTGGAAWSLAGRERGLPLVVSLVVLTQGVLHSVFELAQSTATSAAGPDTTSPGSKSPGHAVESMRQTVESMGHDMSAMPADSMDMGHMATEHAEHMGHMGSMCSTGSVGHDMGGMSSFAMLAAHTLAALLCGLWLAHGERAAFRVLRAVAGWLAAPLRLLFAVVMPPRRLRVRLRCARPERAPRRLPLVHSITPRGPPAGTAVV